MSPLGRAALVAALLAPALTAGCAGSRDKERESLRREESPAELIKKGEASAQIGDMTRAEQYYVAALRSGGDDGVIVRKLLVVCLADQRFPVALEYVDQYLRRHPTDIEIKFAKASILDAMGDVVEARELLAVVVRERPGWSDAHYALATVLREEGDHPDLADQHDLQYLRLNPRGPMAEAARARLSRATP